MTRGKWRLGKIFGLPYRFRRTLRNAIAPRPPCPQSYFNTQAEIAEKAQKLCAFGEGVADPPYPQEFARTKRPPACRPAAPVKIDADPLKASFAQTIPLGPEMF
ncbi:MAG: hypothetical protein J0I23_11465 [Rhizobiales bacterium]|nr:hypothetical protein [Hyphomicrobiales bacterium]